MKKIYLQIIILLNIFLVIIWYYPTIIDFLIIHNRHYSIRNEDNQIDLIAERGTFGDMFGLLNTVFSGIALLGVVYTIYEEKEKARKEKLTLQKEKLAYLNSILKITAQSAKSVISNIDDIVRNSRMQPLVYFPTTINLIESSMERIQKIVNNLDEEVYFIAFAQNLYRDKTFVYRAKELNSLFENLRTILDAVVKYNSAILNTNVLIEDKKIKISAIKEKCLRSPDGNVYEQFLNIYFEWFVGEDNISNLSKLYITIDKLLAKERDNLEFQNLEAVLKLKHYEKEVNSNFHIILTNIQECTLELLKLQTKIDPLLYKITIISNKIDEFTI